MDEINYLGRCKYQKIERVFVKEMKNWVELLGHGDEKALAHFFNLHNKSLQYFAGRMVSDSNDAEDIVSDCFLKLWIQHKDFKTTPNIKAFLYISCRNACLNYLKHLKVISTAQQHYLAELEKGEETILYDIIQTEILDILVKEIDQLPEKCREVFKLIYFDALGTDEIAKKLGISVKTVRNHKANAIAALKSSFYKKDLTGALFLAFMLFIQGK